MGEAYQTARLNYINNSLDAWRNNQANKPKAHKKTEAEKTEDIYKRLIKQQKEQIALAGQNTELAKMKYQVSQGELSTLSEAQKKTLLQNAALIDQKKIREQLAAYETVWRTVMPVSEHQMRLSYWDMVKAHGCVNDFRKCGASGRSLSRKITSY